MKGPPTASLIAAPAEQFSLCRTKEAERERRAEQFPDMLGTVDCLQLVPCSQVIVGNILSVVRSASIGPFSLIVSGLRNQWRGCCRLSIRRRLLQQHEEECRCRFVQIQASCGWSRSVSKRYSRLLAQPRAPRACRIAGMSQFALTSSHKLASTLSTHGRPLPPRAMDDEPPPP